jgi:hypothetical protein
MRADSDIDLLVVRLDEIDADLITWRQQLDDLASNVTAWTGNDARVLELSSREVDAGLASAEAVLVDIREYAVTLHGSTTYLQTAGRRRRV